MSIHLEFLDEILANGSGERIFNSINSWRSRARYSEGMTERISKSDYSGEVLVKISIDGEKVEYSFVPTTPEKPTMRLSQGDDYL